MDSLDLRALIAALLFVLAVTLVLILLLCVVDASHAQTTSLANRKFSDSNRNFSGSRFWARFPLGTRTGNSPTRSPTTAPTVSELPAARALGPAASAKTAPVGPESPALRWFWGLLWPSPSAGQAPKAGPQAATFSANRKFSGSPSSSSSNYYLSLRLQTTTTATPTGNSPTPTYPSASIPTITPSPSPTYPSASIPTITPTPNTHPTGRSPAVIYLPLILAPGG